MYVKDILWDYSFTHQKSEWPEGKIRFNAFLDKLGRFKAFKKIWLIFYKQGEGPAFVEFSTKSTQIIFETFPN